MKLLDNVVSSYSDVNVRYSLWLKRPVKKWTLMLPGSGCEYWKKTGGCSMCGFNGSTQKYTHGHLYPSFIFNSFFRLAEWQNHKNPEELSIFNGGSFWNDKEIPTGFQEKIYRRVAKHDSLLSMLIETRCEYITMEKVAVATRMLSGKRLIVAIGFESQDDHIRNKLVKKGLSKQLFEEKVSLLKRYGASVAAYVFLKPVGLREKEAIDDAISTIEYALSVGVNVIELSCAFIQHGTGMADLYENAKFRPPYLWSVLKIIDKINENNWPVNIGGFTDEPPPIAIPANCENCSGQIYDAIEQFRQTRVLGKITDCHCFKEWEKEINNGGSCKSTFL